MEMFYVIDTNSRCRDVFSVKAFLCKDFVDSAKDKISL
jgi:hypothetical protein